MLNRIKVRGKLLLLLATPLLALFIFAYLGIADRLDTSSSQSREQSLAQLADSGSDLSHAVAHERLVGMIIDAGGSADISVPAITTREAIARWLQTSADATRYINDPATREDIGQLTTRLEARLARGDQTDRSTTSLLAELSILSRSISGINNGLINEAADLGLYRAMFVQGFAGEMQNASTEIAVLGNNAIRTGEISVVASGLLESADSTLTEASTEFQTLADQQYVSMLADLRNASVIPRVANGVYSTSVELAPLIASGDSSSRVSWLQLGLARIDGIHGMSDRLLQDASNSAENVATISSDSAKNFIVLAGSVALAALLMAILIGRSISRPLVRLSRSARQLSDEELPALVESMRTGGRIAAPQMTGIEIKGRDEVAQLSHAVSEIQKVTIEVAEEQTALLHRGISTMFVNLARRNQSLLDRQIQFIDGLERAEEDPDQLDNLFQLDHLATRMRRNAESLLVLAGGEPSRRRGEPVAIESVLRVAVSEIEDYSRVDLRSIETSLMPSSSAVDMAHLASELMENATQFSPPDSRVDVVGHRLADGSYQLTIADHGFGMGEDQIADANKTLSEPPVVGLDMGRSLGFTVIAKIANRLDLTVRLTPTPGGGLTAVVTLPPAMQIHARTEPDDAPHQPVTAIPDMQAEHDDDAQSRLEIGAVIPESVEEQTDLSSMSPESSDSDIFEIFDTKHQAKPSVADPNVDLFADLASATDEIPSVLPSPEPPTSTLPPPPARQGAAGIAPLPQRVRPDAKRRSAPPLAQPLPPAQSDTPAPITAGLTKSGLARRTPGSTVTEVQRPADVPTGTPASRSGRSPDEIREMLSRYRGGLQRGHVPDEDDTTRES